MFLLPDRIHFRARIIGRWVPWFLAMGTFLSISVAALPAALQEAI